QKMPPLPVRPAERVLTSQQSFSKVTAAPMSKIGRFPCAHCWSLFAILILVSAKLLSATQQAGSGNFETLSEKASSAREAGRTEEAIRNYRAAVELRPAWDEGWWYLGTLLYDSDHFEDAIPALQHLVELDPKLGPARAFLGLCEFETGDYPRALENLQSAYQLGFSEDPEIEKVSIYHLALLLNLRGEFERAAGLLSKS